MQILSRYLFCFLLVMAALPGYGQQIVWEKKVGWIASSDVFTAVCEADSGNFMALGYSDRHLVGSSIVVGYGFNIATITKFNSEGDTLFSKELNLYCQSWGTPYIGRFWNNQYVAIVNVELPTGTSTASIKRYPAILILNSHGSVVESKHFPQFNEVVISGVTQTSDNGLILSGYHLGGLISIDSMFAIKVNFLLEKEWGGMYGNIANGSYRGECLEPMANGNYLVSGSLGKRVYSIELDSNGTQLGEKIIYQTPSNRVFYRSQAHQAFNKGFLSYGYYLDGSSNTVGYFGRNDSLGNKIWGGEVPFTNVNSLLINRENSFLVAKNGTESSLSRLTKDSSTIWKISLGIGFPLKFVHGLTFTQPDTGIVFGYYEQQTGNLGQQFWLAKIAGVGTAYDPTHPEDTINTPTVEKLFLPKDSPTLYPNPASGHVQFQKLTAETVVAIYSTKGEKLLEKTIQTNESVNVSQLSRGFYLYHLKMGDRVFTGRFLKE